MPSFGELYGKNTPGTERSVSFNQFYNLGPKEIQKRKKEQERQNNILQAQQLAQESNAEVARNTVGNLSNLEKIKRYGPSAAKDSAVSVVKAVADPFIKLGNMASTVQNRGVINDRTAQLDQALDKIRQSSLSESEKSKAEDTILKAKSEILFGELKGADIGLNDSKATIGRKFLANTAQAASTFAPIGGIGTSLTRATVQGGLAGLAGGASSALAEDEVTAKNLLLNSGTGLLLGAGAGALSNKFSVWLRDRNTAKVAPTSLTPEAPQAITDPSRLLPDGTPSRVRRIAEIDQEIDNMVKNPTTYKPKPTTMKNLGSEPTTTTTPRQTAKGTPDLRTRETKVQGVVTPTETIAVSTKGQQLRELVKERRKLIAEIEQIKNPTVRIAEEINLVDEDLARAQRTGDSAGVRTFTTQSQFLDEQAGQLDTTIQSRVKQYEDFLLKQQSQRGAGKQPMAAQRTEALAIEKKLADGYDIDATPTMNLQEQAEIGEALARTDRDAAVRMAMGLETPPGNVQPSTMYAIMRDVAAKEGDAVLLKRLAEESTVPGTGKALGQYNAAFAYKDPESPLTAIETVMKARKDAGVVGTVSLAETEEIASLSQKLTQAKDVYLLDPSDVNRLNYGKSRILYDNYVNELVASSTPSLKQALRNPSYYKKKASDIIGLPKSIVASLDNSVIGRQGWKTLMTSPKTWAKNSYKSFYDIARTYKGKNVLDEVHADMVSRENALNGMYRKAGIDVYGAKKEFLEEAFPTSFGKVTKTKAGKFVLRPFTASETAFSAWQQRTRADLFDWYLDDYVKRGGNINSKKDIRAIGNMVNSLTSRGKLPAGMEGAAGTLNKLFFSPRLLASNFQVLGGHVLTGAGGSNYVRKRAARNLVKIALGSAVALKLASAATGGKIETDPRSSDFGKLRIGDTRYDLAGGMGGLVTLGSRILPTMNDGQLGFFKKSSADGEVRRLNSGDFGDQTAENVLLDFFGNKLSPSAAALRDVWRGRDFDGNKPTVASTAKNLTYPLIIRQIDEVRDMKNPATAMASIISESLGIGTNTYGLNSDWNSNNTKRVQGFKSNVSKQTFEEANKEFNTKFKDWYATVSNNESFWKLSLDERENLVTSKKDELTEDVLQSKGYRYKPVKRDNSTRRLIEELKRL